MSTLFFYSLYPFNGGAALNICSNPGDDVGQFIHIHALFEKPVEFKSRRAGYIHRIKGGMGETEYSESSYLKYRDSENI